MMILHTPAEAAAAAPAAVLAAGCFDGVHLGHQALLRTARAFAQERGAQAWVLTFDPHPLSVVAPARCPPRLTTLPQRLALLEEAGMDGCLVIPFTERFAALEPQAFATRVLGCWTAVPGRSCAVVSGPNWRFGHGHAGRLSDLYTLTGGAVSVREEPFVCRQGEPVSSSRIRKLILAGALGDAAQLLGRAYRIEERAAPAPSRGVGTQLGTPTANVLPTAAVLPPQGVYAVDVRRTGPGAEKGPWHRAVANYGFRPTFPDARPDRPVLEIHIPGHRGALYGAALEIAFLRRLRGERAFDTPEALGAQIRADVAQALNLP